MTCEQGYLNAKVMRLVLTLCCVTAEGQNSGVFLQLTNTNLAGSNHFPPGISKDGTKVGFLSRTNLGGLNPFGDIALYVMNANGTGVMASPPPIHSPRTASFARPSGSTAPQSPSKPVLRLPRASVRLSPTQMVVA